MRLFDHRHRRRTQKDLDYTTIQWCRCGEVYRSKAKVGGDQKWNTWVPLVSWMIDEPR